MREKNILLINNDVELLSLFSIVFGEIGYKLKVVLDKDTSKEIMSNTDIDLVIIDLTFDVAKPYELLKYFTEFYPDIPRIAILTKDMFNSNDYYEKVYSNVYDVIVKPIVNQDDLKKRIMRAIENRNLVIENKRYMDIVIDKSFRAGMLNILSSMLNRVDNYIDQLLAELFIWKEQFLLESHDTEKQKEKFIDFINNFKDKIINLEEIIQINEVLLSEYSSEKGININEIIEDILKILKDTLEKKGIEVKTEYTEIPNTHLESLKVVQCILHFIEESIFNFRYSLAKEKRIEIMTKTKDINEKKFIAIEINDNSFLVIDNLNLIALHNEEILKDSIFSLNDIKAYLQNIGGSLNITNDLKNRIRRIKIELPVV
ncbi:MAG TPA: hypothetical protein PLE45_09165 [Spirochaetota bacterium]|nr:hypothetical protein [Spirochaetota bacterium]HOL56283.1 hypothetical protein [Spirochaetota bacterium]